MQEKIKVIIADTQFLITESVRILLAEDGRFQIEKITDNLYSLEKTLKALEVQLLIPAFVNPFNSSFFTLSVKINIFKLGFPVLIFFRSSMLS